ncbi:MAG: Fe-S cluster assembly protein IscX [Bacteroidota bacterium]
MELNDAEINLVAGIILEDYGHLFPSTYPDIPLNLTMLKASLGKAGIVTEKNEIPDIMERVELALAAIVPLRWSNYGSIAILLNQQYPDEDLLAISVQRVAELTRALPNFRDEGMPEEDVMDSIIYTWISLTDEDLDLTEEEAWS